MINWHALLKDIRAKQPSDEMDWGVVVWVTISLGYLDTWILNMQTIYSIITRSDGLYKGLRKSCVFMMVLICLCPCSSALFCVLLCFVVKSSRKPFICRFALAESNGLDPEHYKNFLYPMYCFRIYFGGDFNSLLARASISFLFAYFRSFRAARADLMFRTIYSTLEHLEKSTTPHQSGRRLLFSLFAKNVVLWRVRRSVCFAYS